MTDLREEACQPVFLDAAGRRLFALISACDTPRPPSGVLICPAFAEEMNRTRRTVRLLIGELRKVSIPGIALDLFGTGDSDGQFAEATWDTWLEDLEHGADRLMHSGCTRIVLVAVRAGSLLATDLIRRRHYPYSALVLWQPVLRGSDVLIEQLRARVAAAAMAGRTESVAALRKEFAAGRTVEACGYELNPTLATALETRELVPTEVHFPPVVWIEIGDQALRASVPGILARIDANGSPTKLLRQHDPCFWRTTETTIGRGTVARTVEVLSRKLS